MKKLVLVCAVAAMAFTFTACNNKVEEAANQDIQTVETAIVDEAAKIEGTCTAADSAKCCKQDSTKCCKKDAAKCDKKCDKACDKK